MRTLTMYECEVCGRRDVDEGAIARCEARGRPPTFDEVPIGLVVDVPYIHGIQFVQVFARRPEFERREHGWNGGWWTFRDRLLDDGSRVPTIGDSVGDERTTGPSMHSGWFGNPEGNRYAGPAPGTVDPSTPAYRRAWEYLRSEGIEPTVWSVEAGKPVTAPEPTSQPAFVRDLVDAAAEAVDRFDPDELEAFASKENR